MFLFSFFIGAHVSATTATATTRATWLHFVYVAVWQVAMHLNKHKHLTTRVYSII